MVEAGLGGEHYTSSTRWQHVAEEAKETGEKVRDIREGAWEPTNMPKPNNPPQRDHNGRDFGDSRGTETSRFGPAWATSPTPPTKFAHAGSTETEKYSTMAAEGKPEIASGICTLCGAWWGSLGLEPILDCKRPDGELCAVCYCCHSVMICRALKEVLAEDGIMFWNVADSYIAGTNAPQKASKTGGVSRWGREDQNYRANAPGMKPKDLAGMPGRVAQALQEDGWFRRADIIWGKGVSFNKKGVEELLKPFEEEAKGSAIWDTGTHIEDWWERLKEHLKNNTYTGNNMPECLDPETQVFVRQSGWVSRVRIKDIPMMTPQPLILGPNGFVPILNLWNVVKPALYVHASKVESVICSPGHRFPVSSDRRRVRWEPKEASEIRNEGYNDYFLYSPIDRFLDPTVMSMGRFQLDALSGFLVGIYAAEGGKDGDGGFRIKLTLGAHEEELLQRVGYTLTQLHIQYSHKPYRNAVEFRFSDESVQRFISSFITGDVKTKQLNIDLLLNCPLEFRLGLLEGYVEGDGHYRNNGWSAASASIRLRDDLSTLASSVGVITSKGGHKYTDKRTGNTYQSWSLSTPYASRRKEKKEQPGVYQVPPRGRKVLEGEREMVEIEVEGGLFLIGDGLISHNSTKDRPSRSYEYIFMFTKKGRYYADMDALRESHSPVSLRRAENNFNPNEDGKYPDGGHNTLRPDQFNHPAGRNARMVWHFGTRGFGWQLCTNCNTVYDQSEYKRLPKVKKPVTWKQKAEAEDSPVLGAVNHVDGGDTGLTKEKGQMEVGVCSKCGSTDNWGSHFSCVDEETECLTAEGWKPYAQLRLGELVAQYDMEMDRLSWGSLLNVSSYDVEDQDMVSVEHRDLRLLMTPNHRCVVRNYRGYADPYIRRADELLPTHAIPTAAHWDFVGCKPVSPEWAELVGWYIAEGHECRDSSAIEIYQSSSANPEKVQRIKDLLEATEAEYHAAEYTRLWRGHPTKQVTFRVNGYVAAKLRELSPKKQLPNGVLLWSKDLVRALLDGLIAGDGSIRGGTRLSFTQKDKTVMDMVQALAVRLGFSAVVTHALNRSIWRLYLSTHKFRTFRGTNGRSPNKSVEKYTGTVWCPQTEKGTWVARRQGRVFITGNSFPMDLPENCILMGSREGDVVLDPFAGTGTTLLAALKHGRKAVGIELSKEYTVISTERLKREERKSMKK